MEKTSEEDTEICGFLDVKYLGNKRKTQKVRKRTLASWKVWRRHWCSIKKLGPGLGIRVQLDCGIGNSGTVSTNQRDNSMIIPLDSVICRVQSRSKQFAFGVFPAKERKPLLYFAGNSETESQRWMANIRKLLRPRKHRFMPGAHSISMVDNSHSKASGLTGLYGDLVASSTGVFVKDSHTGEIVENFEWSELENFHLITAGRPEDVKCICVIHTTKEFRGGVGVLHVFCLDASRLLQDLVTRGRGPRKFRHNEQRPLSLSEGDLRITAREDMVSVSSQLRGRADSLFTFESRAVENVYEDFDQSRRRVSDISTGSGIYEEIAEDERSMSSEFYQKLAVSSHKMEPPPLPPRRRCGSDSAKSNSVNDLNLTSISTKKDPEETTEKLENSNYVPMSPRLKDVTLQQLREQTTSQENDYVIMR